jgi:two-component system OmpR family response regulator
MILIVDDDYDIALLIRINLQKAGLFAFSFTDPVAALEEFRSHHREYDLVISDIGMPAMNGYELAEQVKKIKPDVKILLMSALEYSNRHFAEAIFSTDIDGFVEKPFSISNLCTTLLTILNHKTLRHRPNVPLS